MDLWFKNISYTLLGKVAAMFFLMFLDMAAARFLEIDTYAEWVYFLAILTMMFWIGWAGINSSVKVHISKINGKTEQACCIKSAAVLRLAASFIISSVIYFVMPRCAGFLGYPHKYPNLKWLFAAAAILVFLNSFTEFFKGIFMGTQMFRKLFVFTAAEYAGYFIFSLISLAIIKNVKAIIYGYLISGIVTSLIGWNFIIKYYKSELYPAEVSFHRYIKPVFKYAIPIAMISVGGIILVEMDTFMLGLLSTKENVAIYSIAKNLCSKATHLNYSLTVGVMTSFAIITKESFLQQRAAFKKASMINYAITIIVLIAFLLLGQAAIDILYGSQYTKAGRIIHQLVIYYALYGISSFYSSFLDFRNKAGIRSIWYASVIIINLVLNYLWIPRYGAEGAAWATDLSLIPYTLYAITASYREWNSLYRKNL